MSLFDLELEIEDAEGKFLDATPKVQYRTNELKTAMSICIIEALKAIGNRMNKKCLMTVSRECSQCKGRKYIANDPPEAPLTAICPTCGGSGVEFILRRVAIMLSEKSSVELQKLSIL